MLLNFRIRYGLPADDDVRLNKIITQSSMQCRVLF